MTLTSEINIDGFTPDQAAGEYWVVYDFSGSQGYSSPSDYTFTLIFHANVFTHRADGKTRADDLLESLNTKKITLELNYEPISGQKWNFIMTGKCLEVEEIDLRVYPGENPTGGAKYSSYVAFRVRAVSFIHIAEKQARLFKNMSIRQVLLYTLANLRVDSDITIPDNQAYTYIESMTDYEIAGRNSVAILDFSALSSETNAYLDHAQAILFQNEETSLDFIKRLLDFCGVYFETTYSRARELLIFRDIDHAIDWSKIRLDTPNHIIYGGAYGGLEETYTYSSVVMPEFIELLDYNPYHKGFEGNRDKTPTEIRLIRNLKTSLVVQESFLKTIDLNSESEEDTGIQTMDLPNLMAMPTYKDSWVHSVKTAEGYRLIQNGALEATAQAYFDRRSRQEFGRFWFEAGNRIRLVGNARLPELGLLARQSGFQSVLTSFIIQGGMDEQRIYRSVNRVIGDLYPELNQKDQVSYIADYTHYIEPANLPNGGCFFPIHVLPDQENKNLIAGHIDTINEKIVSHNKENWENVAQIQSDGNYSVVLHGVDIIYPSAKDYLIFNSDMIDYTDQTSDYFYANLKRDFVVSFPKMMETGGTIESSKLDSLFYNGTQVLVSFFENCFDYPFIFSTSSLQVFNQQESHVNQALDKTFDYVKIEIPKGHSDDKIKQDLKDITTDLYKDVGYYTDTRYGFNFDSGMRLEASINSNNSYVALGGKEVYQDSGSYQDKSGNTVKVFLREGNVYHLAGSNLGVTYLRKTASNIYREIALSGYSIYYKDSNYVTNVDISRRTGFLGGFGDSLSLGLMELPVSPTAFVFGDNVTKRFNYEDSQNYATMNSYNKAINNAHLSGGSDSVAVSRQEMLFAKGRYTNSSEWDGHFLVERYIGRNYSFRDGVTYSWHIQNDEVHVGAQENSYYPSINLNSKPVISDETNDHVLASSFEQYYPVGQAFAERKYVDDYKYVHAHHFSTINGSVNKFVFGTRNIKAGAFSFHVNKIIINGDYVDARLRVEFAFQELEFYSMGSVVVWSRSYYEQFRGFRSRYMAADEFYAAPFVSNFVGFNVAMTPMGAYSFHLPLGLLFTTGAIAINVGAMSIKQSFFKLLNFMAGMLNMVMGLVSLVIGMGCAAASVTKSGYTKYRSRRAEIATGAPAEATVTTRL